MRLLPVQQDNLSYCNNGFLQSQLHPLMQTYLAASTTFGDGNCLFYSIRKLISTKQENTTIAKFLRLMAIYTIYKDEEYYRQLVNIDANTDQYTRDLRDIYQMNSYCGDTAMLVMANVMDRPIYVYRTFIEQQNQAFHFYEDSDFETLKTKFADKKPGTQQHRIYLPRTETWRGKQALTVFYHESHYTALTHTRAHEDLIPTTNLFNLHLAIHDT